MDAPIVILSPHLDDAVLSCWRLLDGPADVWVVNIFAGVPSPGVGSGWWDRLGGRADPRRTVRERIAEDRSALALARREPVYLDFLDRQYRRGPQPLEPLVRAVRPLLPAGATVLAPYAFAPLGDHGMELGYGQGPHPDHAAARDVALALRGDGFPVSLYADLPHASSWGWPEWVTGEAHSPEARRAVALWQAALAGTGVAPDELAVDARRLSPAALERKLRAVGRYQSQVETIERAFGRRIDDPTLLGHEVVWRLPATAATARS